MPIDTRGVQARDGGSRPAFASGDLPRWFAVGLNSALAIVAGFGLVGLAGAVLGVFVPALVVPLGCVASLVLARWGRSGTGSGSHAPVAHMPSLGAAALALAFAATSIFHEAQHVLIDRDPGAYLNTGRWLAGHSGLVFRADVGAFRGTPGLAFDSPAVNGHGPAMHFQFAHLLGVLLAEARWLGGDRLMFAFVPILGGLSIALFYAVARHFVRPAVALIGSCALAVNVVQLHFSRDAYSEIVLQFVLLGSVWLLAQPGLDRRRSFVAGVLLGATVAARIDGPLYLAAVPVVVAIAAARRARNVAGDGSARLIGPFCAGVAFVAGLAVLDVVWRSPEYVHSLGVRAPLPFAVLIGAVVGAACLSGRVARWRRGSPAKSRVPSAAGAACVVVLTLEWLVRPYVQHVRGAAIPLVGLIQHAENLTFDPRRHYYENSLRWFAWYLGPLALAAGILGIGRLVRDTLREGDTYAWVLTAAFVATGTVYLWNANALPDQLWVMRRFVPVVLPGFVLGAVLVVDWLIDRRSRWGTVSAVVLGVAMLAWPLSATAIVPDEATQANLMGALNATCRAIGPHAAVVVVAGDISFDQIAPQAIRGFCGVPVAIRRPGLTAADLEALARRFRSEGRRLVLVGDTPEHIRAVVPGIRARSVASVVDVHELQQTLTKPPHSYFTKTYSFAVGEVPVRAP